MDGAKNSVSDVLAIGSSTRYKRNAHETYKKAKDIGTPQNEIKTAKNTVIYFDDHLSTYNQQKNPLDIYHYFI